MLPSNAQRPPMHASVRAFFIPPRGYTLVELVVVLAILSIIGAMAAPRWGRSVARARVTAAVQRITADFAAASVQARATSTPLAVTFSVPGGSYTVANTTRLDRRAGAYTVELDQDPYLVRLDSAAFGAGSVVTFNQFGVPDLDGTVVVSAGEFQRTIRFYAVSREVVVQ